MRPLQFLLFDFMKSSLKIQWFLYLGLKTKFKLKGKMLHKGFEDKCQISEVFDIINDYKIILILENIHKKQNFIKSDLYLII